MRVRPDDEVYRVDAVWLGPQGMTLPWTARYSAYGIWLVLFVTILLFEAALPMSVSIPPVWEVVISVLATYALTGVIDHDRPVHTVWQLVRAELNAPRAPRRPSAANRFTPSRIRIRESHAGTTPTAG
ncbi:hypothetical protein [Nocardioides caldifontis]|uniref:hypothetical protein n=1 Tax=Nocardioides caldifontis TaxID=2588938 RepID=UPI0011E02E29|nr:hypothetical protein [Nocardioides caldifontis]